VCTSTVDRRLWQGKDRFMVELSAGVKAAEMLNKELARERSRRSKARVASRILTEELERVDQLLAVARNSETAYWPDASTLSVPAWDEHRLALADLLDNQTWDTTKDAVTLPQSVIQQARADSAGAETITGTLDALRVSNAAARAKLVTYASKPGVLGWLSRARNDERIKRRAEILGDD